MHVGGAMLEGIPHAREELRTGPQQDRQTQHSEKRPHDSPCFASGRHPFAQARDEIRIAQAHDRNGDDSGEPEFPHQRAVFLQLRQIFRTGHLLFRLLSPLWLGDAVPRRLDRLAEDGERGLLRLIFDVDRIRAKIGARRDNARGQLQRELDADDARAAVHELDGNAYFGGPGGVADGPDRAQEISYLRPRWVEIDARECVRKIHLGTANARDGFEGVLDRWRTMRAGHCPNREVDVLHPADWRNACAFPARFPGFARDRSCLNHRSLLRLRPQRRH